MKNFKNKTRITNVLVIGCGGSGLRAAIEAKNAGVDVIVLGKRPRRDAHTVLAAGGINAALANVDPEDTWKQHFADTMIEGYGLSEPRMVELMAKEAPEIVKEIDAWGANFAKTKEGKIDQRYFGAHTYRRTCYSGDYTGRTILFALVDKAEELDIEINDNQYVTEVLMKDGVCFGAMTFNTHTGERIVYQADSVIIATGGHNRIWRKSSSRTNENTGDGFSIGLKAGCTLKDVELVQFHPTGMVMPEDIAGTLISEAVRGEGGILRNSKGERFMEKYDKERMELSTRDRVALANYTEIIEGRGSENGAVYLDISHKGKDFIIEKLPRMYRQYLDALMVDISKEPMEVAPTAHYSMGGIKVDPDTHSTGIEGLYAVGEVTGGLHGANRLGGNSLAEILIFGKRVGKAAAERSENLEAQVRCKDAIQRANEKIDSFIKPGDTLARPLQRELRDIMWETCGVLRSEDKLKEGVERIRGLRDRISTVDVRLDSEGCEDLIRAFDLEASLISAEATVLAAIERKESRGAHQRKDYPETSKEYSVNFEVNLKGGELVVTKHELHDFSDELKQVVKNTKSIEDFNGMLVE